MTQVFVIPSNYRAVYFGGRWFLVSNEDPDHMVTLEYMGESREENDDQAVRYIAMQNRDFLGF